MCLKLFISLSSISTTDGLENHIFFNSRRLKRQRSESLCAGTKGRAGGWRGSLAPGGGCSPGSPGKLPVGSAPCSLLAGWVWVACHPCIHRPPHSITYPGWSSPSWHLLLSGRSGASFCSLEERTCQQPRSLSDLESYLEVLHLEDPEETSLFIDCVEQGSQTKATGANLACYLLF